MSRVGARRNILLISFDDCFAYQHYRTAFGVPLQVPNLDRIADVSARFDAAYCQAPICGPSRASLMSARTPHQLGLFNNDVDVFQRLPPEEIWSYRLKESGYFCSSGGKVHHGYGPLAPAIHAVLYSDARKRFGSDFSLPPDVPKRRYGGIRGGWGTTDPKDDGIFYDAKSADSAIAFLQSYDGDAPFYREVGFFSPHGPRFTPARFKELYDVDAFTPPAAWQDGFDAHPYTDDVWPQTPALQSGDERWWRSNLRNYFSGLSHGDHHLGRVWDALRASRFAQDTVVVITSDHGFLLGARNRFYKSTVWEQSAGVPLIIHDPECSGPRVIADPVALIDVGPTLLDYAGLPPLPETVGQSLRPQVEGAARPDRAVPTFRYDNVSIRKGGYRLARYMDGSTQLFDLAEDIWNLHDLGAAHPAFDGMQDALMSCCAEYGMAYELE